MNPVAVGNGVVRLAPRLRRRWWWWAAGAVVVLGGATLAWRLTHASVAIPASDLYTVQYGNVTQTVATTGTLQAPQQVALSFLSSGQLKALDVTVGQHVQAGQTLAQLNDATIAPQVAQAQAQLASAQAALQKAEEGPTPQAVAVAQANLQHAQVVLQGAQQQYQDEQAIFNDRLSAQQSLQQAQDQVNQDAAALQAAEVGLAKAQNALQQTQVNVSTSAVASLNNTIQQDQDQLSAANQQYYLDSQILSADQTSAQTAQTIYNEYVTLWGSLDPTTYAQAQACVSEGTSCSSTFTLGPSTVSASAYVSAYTTETGAYQQWQSYLQAEQKQQQLLDSDSAQIQAAQANLTNAQNQLSNLEQTNSLSVQAAQIAVQQAQASVNQAQAAYQAAENSLAMAQQLYNDRTSAQAQLDQAANAVAQAQNGVTQAQAQLAQTEAPPDPATVAQAQAQVQSAEAALKAAEASEANTVLTAPISGVVVATNGTVGQEVTPNTAVVTIDDTVKGDLQINLQVPEADIGAVHAGEAVNLTVPAYPTTTFHGTVTQVYPTPQLVDNVNEYTVLATVHDASGKLTPGMSANVTIVTAEVHHVLVVPPVALHTVGSVEGVYVTGKPGQAQRPAFAHRTRRRRLRSGGATGGSGTASGVRAAGLPAGVYFQPVTVGLFGTDAVQITRGLQAGQQILLVLPGATGSSPTTPSGTPGQAPGGFRPGVRILRRG